MVNDSPGSVEVVLALADGAECVVPRAGLTIGRAETAGLVLSDPLVSHRHAQITTHDDTYYLADLGSLNGTRRNGENVTTPVALANGDILELAGTTVNVVFRAPAPRGRPRSETMITPVQEISETPRPVQPPTISSTGAPRPPRLTVTLMGEGSPPTSAGAGIALAGVLDIETAEEFRRRTGELAASGVVDLSLDLAELRYMDSSGLSALVGLMRSLKAGGGEIRLRNAQPTVRGIIELTRLDGILNLE